jgi:hypothetical protein
LRGDKLRTIESAEKTAIIVKVLESICVSVHAFSSMVNYLRVATQKRVVFSTKGFKEFVSMLKVWNPGNV